MTRVASRAAEGRRVARSVRRSQRMIAGGSARQYRRPASTVRRAVLGRAKRGLIAMQRVPDCGPSLDPGPIPSAMLRSAANRRSGWRLAAGSSARKRRTVSSWGFRAQFFVERRATARFVLSKSKILRDDFFAQYLFGHALCYDLSRRRAVSSEAGPEAGCFPKPNWRHPSKSDVKRKREVWGRALESARLTFLQVWMNDGSGPREALCLATAIASRSPAQPIRPQR
jgi:hypothetical protein